MILVDWFAVRVLFGFACWVVVVVCTAGWLRLFSGVFGVLVACCFWWCCLLPACCDGFCLL